MQGNNMVSTEKRDEENIHANWFFMYKVGHYL